MKKIVVFLLISLVFPLTAFASEELSAHARAFYSDNNFDRTMDMLLQIDEKNRTAENWLLLGNLLDEKGEKDNAIFMYQKAIDTDKNFYKAYYNLANIYISEDRYNMAIENYIKASKLNRENPYVFYNLGCAYLKAGQIKKAKTAFITAVTIKNDVPEFHYNLAYVYKSLNNPKLAQTYLDNYNKLSANSTGY